MTARFRACFVALLAAVPALAGESSVRPVAQLGHLRAPECSGLVASRTHPGLFWTHQDSGGPPALFAFRTSGEPVTVPGRSARKGLRIKGATNVDWEDLALSPDGVLYIADIGNNHGRRRDLVIYALTEPDPNVQAKVSVDERYPFRYPDQTAFPPANDEFDAEALFWCQGKLHLLTKHKRDRTTVLYRFEVLEPGTTNIPTRVAAFDHAGSVTGADATWDGKRLAMLTPNRLWLFEAPPAPCAYFQGRVRVAKLPRDSWEGVAFSGGELYIINEEGELALVPEEAFRNDER